MLFMFLFVIVVVAFVPHHLLLLLVCLFLYLFIHFSVCFLFYPVFCCFVSSSYSYYYCVVPFFISLLLFALPRPERKSSSGRYLAFYESKDVPTGLVVVFDFLLQRIFYLLVILVLFIDCFVAVVVFGFIIIIICLCVFVAVFVAFFVFYYYGF